MNFFDNQPRELVIQNPTIVITPAQGDMGIGASGTDTQSGGALGTTTTVYGG
jgi:hypothetical protein